MDKRRSVVYLIFIAFAVAMILILSYSRKETQKQLLYNEISEVISSYKTGRTQYIDFSAITTFSWDRMYIFAPYSGCERIDKAVGTITFWFDCQFTGIEMGKNSSLFIFTQKRKVVRYVLYEGYLDDFSRGFEQEGFKFQEAHFITDKIGRMVWVGH